MKLLILLLIKSVSTQILFMNSKLGFIRSDSPSTDDIIKTKGISQRLDHFKVNETRYWRMRYFERMDLWKKNGPILIYIGGESEADPGYLRSGNVFNLMNEIGAAGFATEHRFYGKSIPYNNTRVKHLIYLTVKLAMADIAKLIETLKSLNQFKKSKVVLVGGSYAGILATWMRLTYPHLVDAVYASSAPILAKVDFWEYYETVTDNYRKYGGIECYNFVANTFQRYDSLLRKPESIEQFKLERNICEYSNLSIKENQILAIYSATGDFITNSQSGNARTIKDHCASLIETKGQYIGESRAIRALKEELDLIERDDDCFNIDFEKIMKALRRSTSYIRTWLYQQCTEFGFAISTTSNRQMFTKNIPIEIFYRVCTEAFDKNLNPLLINEAIKEINNLYGGLRPNASKVVFINGGMDPWHRLSVVKDLSSDAPAVFVPDASHCKDLAEDSYDDPKGLQEGRKKVISLIKTWISVDNNES